MKATLSKSGRELGTITLLEGVLAVNVADSTHKAHLEDVFRETGDFTFAWTRRDVAGTEPAVAKPAVAKPNTGMWLNAILMLKLVPEGYRFTLDSA